MNIATGEVTKTGPVNTYMAERNLMLDDEELVKTRMILPALLKDYKELLY